MSSPAAKVLFVYSRESSFVAIDRSVLAERWVVRDWRQQGPVVNLPALVRAVRAQRPRVRVVRLVAHVLAGDARVAACASRRCIVIGGYDTARMPEIGYGLQDRGLMRPISRWVMRRATRLRDQLALQPRGGGRERGHRSAPRDGRLPRRSRPVRRAAAGEARSALALTVGIVDRRNLERKGLRSFVQAAARAARCRVRAGGAVGRRGGRRAARRRDAERDAHRLGRGGGAERAVPARLRVRAGLRARGLRPVGGRGDAGGLHPGDDARRRAARGGGRHRRAGRRGGARRSSRRRSATRSRRTIGARRRRASVCSRTFRSTCGARAAGGRERDAGRASGRARR